MQRTLALDALQQIGKEITLAGWASSSRDHGGLIFIDLRDHTGLIQLTIGPDQKDAFTAANTVRDEFVIKASGIVVQRAEGLANPNIPTGSVEIQITELEI